jgi:hypothetical protein
MRFVYIAQNGAVPGADRGSRLTRQHTLRSLVPHVHGFDCSSTGATRDRRAVGEADAPLERLVEVAHPAAAVRGVDQTAQLLGLPVLHRDAARISIGDIREHTRAGEKAAVS